MTLAVTVIPFIGFLVAMVVLWGSGISALDVGILAGMYAVTGLGVTIGFHRMLTHGSFDASNPLRVLFAILGSLAVEGSVIAWVADHRRHHAFTDRPGDPHSPHLAEAEGIRGILQGLWHAHMGWFFDPDTTNVQRFAPDLLKDRPIRIVSKLFPLWVVLSFALPTALGFALTGTIKGALTALLWGGLVRIFLLHHVSWSTNSICHFFGKRPFDSRDFSTNNWALSVLSFGEAWHNNHHAFPTSARHGLERWQLDPSWAIISLLERAGLVWDVKRPSPTQLEAKRAATGVRSERWRTG